MGLGACCGGINELLSDLYAEKKKSQYILCISRVIFRLPAIRPEEYWNRVLILEICCVFLVNSRKQCGYSARR